MERSAPSETDKETANVVRAVNVVAPATVGSFAPTVGKIRKTQEIIMHLDWLTPNQRSASDPRP
jgi:thiamine biosynthesis lipoprotein ApbE